MSTADPHIGVAPALSCVKSSAGLLRMLAASLLSLALLGPAFARQEPTALQQQARQEVFEQQRVDYLIDSVSALKGASFIRNGVACSAARAASHMRMKLRLAGSRVHTAEDFIACCATGSSVSGIKYEIRFADGHSIDSASFLRHKLAEYSPPPARFALCTDLIRKQGQNRLLEKGAEAINSMEFPPSPFLPIQTVASEPDPVLALRQPAPTDAPSLVTGWTALRPKAARAPMPPG